MTTPIVPKTIKSRNAPPTYPTFLEILSPTEVRPNALEIITAATHAQPGQARLGAAYIGEVQPDAPQSRPLLSATRAKIGFVVDGDLVVPPYNDAYLIVEEAAR